MGYRGGGRGDQHGPPYGQGRGTGGGGQSSGFVCSPPASTPRPVPAQYQAAPTGFGAPMATHQAAYGHAPPASQVVFLPPPASVPVTIRAPPPTPSPAPAPINIRAPPPAPAPATRQPATASDPASSTAALAKEAEKKLFVFETALAPTAAAAATAVAATQVGTAAAAKDAPDVELAPVSKKGLAHPARTGVGTVGKNVIRANHFLVDVADNNLFHYDVNSPVLPP